MELKLTKESICINEVVFDSTLEQSIELDYLLPDYCPSIFKVLKCKIVPKITSERMMNGKLLIDGIAFIKIIYVSEENYRIRSITQKQIFSKSVELKEDYENSTINTYIKCDYVNCRVVNQRRLDIRGAISIKTAVNVMKKIDVLSDITGMGMQVNNQQVTALEKKLCTSKEFTIKEELELAYGKPAISEILNYTASASLTDYKLIANKVILKGEIQLHILYAGEDNEAEPQIMDYTVPISQIIDLSGVTENYQCVIGFDVTNVDINLKQNGNDENKCFDAEFSIRVNCEADKNTKTQLINDVFSTGYNVQANISKIKIEKLISVINENRTCKNCVKLPQGELNCVYDISCDFTNESTRYENGCINIIGNLNISILALDCENMPTLIEKSAPCEMKIEANYDTKNEDIMFNPYITIACISYNLISGNEIEVRADMRICGNLYKFCFYNIVNTVNVDEKSQKQNKDKAVLRLYFAITGERIWDIAKRFNTSVEAIMLENNLENDKLTDEEMLLIPII